MFYERSKVRCHVILIDFQQETINTGRSYENETCVFMVHIVLISPTKASSRHCRIRRELKLTEDVNSVPTCHDVQSTWPDLIKRSHLIDNRVDKFRRVGYVKEIRNEMKHFRWTASLVNLYYTLAEYTKSTFCIIIWKYISICTMWHNNIFFRASKEVIYCLHVVWEVWWKLVRAQVSVHCKNIFHTKIMCFITMAIR